MQEQFLRDLCVSDPDFSVVALRYFNPVGAHESGLIGEDPNGIPNNLFPKVADCVRGKLPRLKVFGNDYDTPDGTCIRDYIHVADLAIGHLNAIEYAVNHKGFEAINLGCGKGYSVLEIIKSYEKAYGKEIPFDIAPRRDGDLSVMIADTEKSERLLGWKAARGIDKMCEDSWNFVKTHSDM